jgi:hypothetical protein
MHHDQPTNRSQYHFSIVGEAVKTEQGGNDDCSKRRIRMTSDTPLSARAKASGGLAHSQIPRYPRHQRICFWACSWHDPINGFSSGLGDQSHILAELRMILLSQNQPQINACDVTSNALRPRKLTGRSCSLVIRLRRRRSQGRSLPCSE